MRHRSCSRLPLVCLLVFASGNHVRAQQTQQSTFSYTGQPYNVSQCNANPVLIGDGGYKGICGSGQVKASIQLPLPAGFSGQVSLQFQGGITLPNGQVGLYACYITPAAMTLLSTFDCSQTPETISDTANGTTIGFGSSGCQLTASLTFSSGAITAWFIWGYCPPTTGFQDNTITTSDSPLLSTPDGEPNPFYDETIDNCDGTAEVCFFGFATSPGTWSTGSASTAPPSQSAAKSLGNPGNQPCPCQTGEPIDIGSGNVFEEVDDYSTAGANRLGFSRYYNSLPSATTLAASLGKNWRTNFDRYLQLSPSSVIAERPDGQQLIFTSSNGIWVSDTDVDLKLANAGSTWTLTDKDDTVETYTAVSSSEATLSAIAARNGYAQTLTYNSSQQLVSVTDSYNRSLTLTYQSGLLQSVKTPDGLVLTYGYSSSEVSGGNDQLASVNYSTTPATSQSYLYENSSLPSALTGLIDEDGNRFATWSYDSNGRGLTSQHAGGADLTTIVYNDTDGSRMVTNALGQQTLYKFTMLQGIPKVTEIDRQAGSTTAAATRTVSYDSNGYLAGQTDWNGNQTTYVNNARGEPTTINEAVGTPQARTTTITYLSNYHLPSQIVTPDLTTNFVYDSSGDLLTKTLTDTTTNTAPYSRNGQTRTWTYTWSNFLLASAKGPRTDVSELTTFTYDASGALTQVTNALNQATKITAHLPGGSPQTVVDPNGVTTTMSYDARLRLLSRTVSTSAGPLMTTYSYDPAGNLLTVTLPDASAISNTYDTAHRLTGTLDLFSNSIAYTLDAAGDRTQTIVANPAGSTTRQHSATYDALARLLTDIGGVGQATSYSYDANGNALALTDPLMHATQRNFDPLNRIITTTDAASGKTSMTYDPHDRPLTVTDPVGNTTSYTYDGFGDVIEEVSPARGTTIYTYDLNANLTQKIDARGAIANYRYDALNRIAAATYPGDSAENITYTYDQASGGFGIGRLTSVTDAAGSLSRTYDERGNMLTETRKNGAASLLTTYNYDVASRIASITYPSGWAVGYARDTMGRITSMTTKAPGASMASSLLSSIAYEPFGPVTALTYGNGIAESRTFDLDYRLTNLDASGSAAIQKLGYGYDAADNVLSISDGVTLGNSQHFGYDVLNRLTSATGGYGSLGYTYDANGNRLTEDPTNTAAPALDGLTTVTTAIYNEAGRLATVNAGTQQLTQYTYDAFGHRSVKLGWLTPLTGYQYDQTGNLLEEDSSTTGTQTDYIYLDGRPVAEISGGKVYFLLDDRLGTPQVATTSSQTAVWVGDYLPFGELSSASQTALLSQDLRLPGQENDAETGLYHNGFREYVSRHGRYSQSDPGGLNSGPNTYTYVAGSPLTRTDITGLQYTFGDQIQFGNVFLGWTTQESSSWYYHYWTSAAVCYDACTQTIMTIPGPYFQTVPISINMPSISEPPSSAVDAVFNLIEATQQAWSLGDDPIGNTLTPALGRSTCNGLSGNQ